jgi:RNA polymerase sigma-70 factor, ECF subfamily
VNKDTNIGSPLENKNFQETTNDHNSIRSVLQGDVNVYGLLVKRYQVPVYNLLLRMLHSGSEAEELTQLVFIKAYEALPGFNFNYRFFSWLYRIAINEALAQMKYQKRYDTLVGMEQRTEIIDEEEPEKELLVRHAIQRLNHKHKAVVILKYYQQLPYKEIAYMLDIPERKVKSRLYDARIQLKHILEQTTYFSYS